VYPKPTTYNTDEIYIPMKIFNFDNYREISDKSRTDYGWVQKSKVFCDEAISEEKIVDDIISDDPSKSNKLILLSEAGNGKSTIARQLITMFGDKYPDKMSFFLDLKHIGRKDKRSLTEMILPEDYQKGLPSENKKKAASAMNVIFKNPADCIFIIDSLEDLPLNSKVIEALVTGESETEISTVNIGENLLDNVDRVLPTWQWVNELLVGKHFGTKTKIILLARPETIAFYKTPNPFHHRRPGLGWNQLNEEYFIESGFAINCIFGLGVTELQNHCPETYQTLTTEIHHQFLKCISTEPSFAYFCRKPPQMLLFYDTFQEYANSKFQE